MSAISATDPAIGSNNLYYKALFVSLRSRITIVASLAFCVLLAILTIQIVTLLVEQAVERDASRRSVEWAEFAVDYAPHIEDLANGSPIKSEEWIAYTKLASFSGVFRYKIFSSDGILRFDSENPDAIGEYLGTHNETATVVLKTGLPYTVVADGSQKPNRPDLYSETYLPVFANGRMVAVAETYMDQTDKTAAVRREYVFVGASMVGMIGLALLLPSIGLWVMVRRLKLNNEELVKFKIRAQASDKAKREFISTVSHELRTPLTSIKGSLEMLRSGKVISLTGPALRLISMAARNASILNLLVNDLLDFEKLDSGNLKMNKRSTDIAKLVKDELDTIETYETHNITYRFTGHDSPLMIHIDPDRIAQVVRNLVSNAAKFSPAGGEVALSIQENDGSIRVEVKDTGCGIAEADQDRIFQKFTQVDSSITRKYNGTGLGLAISKVIVKAHSGEIGVTSVLGEGSVFYFDLPVCDEIEIHSICSLEAVSV